MAGELHSSGLGNVLIILGAAGIVIPAFARLRITPVIGFILIGILVGPSGLGSLAADHSWLSWITIRQTEDIEPIGEYGIILLLFSIGLELSFRRLWNMRKAVFGLGAAGLLGGAMMIALPLFISGQSVAAAIGLGVALSLSSTALVLPISGTKSAVGRSAFSMLLFEDLAIVPIIFLLGALAPQAGGGSWGALLTTLWQGGLVIGVMMLIGRFVLPALFGQAARTKSPELFLSVSLLVVILSSLATSVVGLSPIVGALIAGVLIAETDYQDQVEHMISPFRGLALGVFLISIGMQIDLAYVAANWVPLILAATGVLIANAFVTGALLRFSGARIGTAMEAGLLMASPSETTLIVLAAASVAAVIDPETAKFWQVVTAMGLTITPILARIGHDVARRVEMRVSGQTLTDDIDFNTERTVIIGFGRVGQLVADMLKIHGQPYVAVESNIDVVVAARREGYPVIFGDVSGAHALEKLHLGKANALILTMDAPVLIAQTVKRARKIGRAACRERV